LRKSVEKSAGRVDATRFNPLLHAFIPALSDRFTRKIDDRVAGCSDARCGARVAQRSGHDLIAAGRERLAEMPSNEA
jgi:hypothetical protein